LYGLFTVIIFSAMEGTMEAVESPCSSDDEVLYGPVTKKEIMKTLELRRQTKVHKAMSE
jgi:hypothetical protein